MNTSAGRRNERSSAVMALERQQGRKPVRQRVTIRLRDVENGRGAGDAAAAIVVGLVGVGKPHNHHLALFGA